MTKPSDSSHQSSSQRFFLKLWYEHAKYLHIVSIFLLPISWLYMLLSGINRWKLKRKQKTIPVPVVIVGNITVGGTGKTPFVIALVHSLQNRGFKVGVISRGYGSEAPYYPFLVKPGQTSKTSGDEALLIAESVKCPVVIDRDRVAAAEHIVSSHPDTHVIISDDGMQHYRLSRSFEVVLIDGQRGLGNGLCLPSGPLRESPKRLQGVNWIFSNGEIHSTKLRSILDNINNNFSKTKVGALSLSPKCWRNVKTGETRALYPFPWSKKMPEQQEQSQSIVAVAAIGNPDRFFFTLNEIGVGKDDGAEFETLAFDDHHQFNKQDFSAIENKIILMTSKDAVKCKGFAKQDWWSLDVAVTLPDIFIDEIIHLI